MCSDRSDEAAATFIRKFGMPVQAMDQVRRLVHEPDCLQRIKCGAHLRALLEAAHSPSWFSTQGLQQPLRTRSGSKAGDPLGDVLFTVVATRIFDDVARNLKDAGLVQDLGWQADGPAHRRRFWRIAGT